MRNDRNIKEVILEIYNCFTLYFPMHLVVEDRTLLYTTKLYTTIPSDVHKFGDGYCDYVKGSRIGKELQLHTCLRTVHSAGPFVIGYCTTGIIIRC